MNVTADTIAAEIERRLALIATTASYITNVGTRVLPGRLKLDPTEIPCVVVVEGDDRVREQTRNGLAHLTQAYTVEGHAECDPDRPNDTGRAIVADLKRAIFGEPFAIDGRVLPVLYRGRTLLQREPGTKITAASIRFEVEFAEDLRNPHA